MAKLSKDENSERIFPEHPAFWRRWSYCYFEFPAWSGETVKKVPAQAEIETLNQNLRPEGRGTASRLRNLEAEVDKATEILLQIESLIPEGAPVAWFPPKVRSFFEQHGITGICSIPRTRRGAFLTFRSASRNFGKMTWRWWSFLKAKFVPPSPSPVAAFGKSTFHWLRLDRGEVSAIR
jgi:hypothetical protein